MNIFFFTLKIRNSTILNLEKNSFTLIFFKTLSESFPFCKKVIRRILKSIFNPTKKFFHATPSINYRNFGNLRKKRHGVYELKTTAFTLMWRLRFVFFLRKGYTESF